MLLKVFESIKRLSETPFADLVRGIENNYLREEKAENE